MKNKLILLGSVLAMVAVILSLILNNGANHMNVIDTAKILKKDNKKLVKQNKKLVLNVSKLKQDISKVEEKLETKPIIKIIEITKKVKLLIHDTIVIHDTVYIKEQKNFWGKTKRDTIE